jgi:2-polyprenyl-6-hydroxyphenyl methylase/3-demethylubiquinone-9 3-methyltransferase
MDDHHMPLKDHGHIKFWLPKTLGTLLSDTGFENIEFEYVGRVAPLAKSMIAVAQRPH